MGSGGATSSSKWRAIFGHSSLPASVISSSESYAPRLPGKRSGLPVTPKDLERHNLLRFGYARAVEGWPLVERGAPVVVMPRGNAHASDGEALRQLALGGLGLARLAAFQVKEDIAAGRLVAVLEDHNPGDTEAIHAVFLGAGGQLPSRVRAFLDYLSAKVRLG